MAILFIPISGGERERADMKAVDLLIGRGAYVPGACAHQLPGPKDQAPSPSQLKLKLKNIEAPAVECTKKASPRIPVTLQSHPSHSSHSQKSLQIQHPHEFQSQSSHSPVIPVTPWSLQSLQKPSNWAGLTYSGDSCCLNQVHIQNNNPLPVIRYDSKKKTYRN